MNIWSFAIAHPIAACVLGVSVCASAVGIAYFFAENHTPLIGEISPTVNVVLGENAIPLIADEKRI